MPNENPLHSRLNWDDVRLFLALCRAKSLGDAARSLSVDGSTVSRRLATMEETLAATLFDRGRNGITATDAAERLLPVAEEIEDGMSRFAGTVEGLEREVAGLVRIACPPDAAEVLVAPHLPSLFAKYPKLEVEIVAGEGVVDISRREADIAMRTLRPKRGDLIVTKLFTIRWRAAATKRLAAKLGPLRAWSDVAWIGATQRMADTTPGRWTARHLAGVRPRLRTTSLRVQIAAIEAHLGAALLPDQSIVHYKLAPLELAPKLSKAAAPWPENDVYFVTHPALRRVPRVAAVWEFFADRARALAGERLR
jgi:DNA-binding transcriptional LysR family regulator